MIKKMIEKMISEINQQIELYYDLASKGKSGKRDKNNVFWEITGMLTMLEMLTGESYEWDKNGVYFR